MSSFKVEPHLLPYFHILLFKEIHAVRFLNSNKTCIPTHPFHGDERVADGDVPEAAARGEDRDVFKGGIHVLPPVVVDGAVEGGHLGVQTDHGRLVRGGLGQDGGHQGRVKAG